MKKIISRAAMVEAAYFLVFWAAAVIISVVAGDYWRVVPVISAAYAIMYVPLENKLCGGQHKLYNAYCLIFSVAAAIFSFLLSGILIDMADIYNNYDVDDIEDMFMLLSFVYLLGFFFGYWCKGLVFVIKQLRSGGNMKKILIRSAVFEAVYFLVFCGVTGLFICLPDSFSIDAEWLWGIHYALAAVYVIMYFLRKKKMSGDRRQYDVCRFVLSAAMAVISFVVMFVVNDMYIEYNNITDDLGSAMTAAGFGLLWFNYLAGWLVVLLIRGCAGVISCMLKPIRSLLAPKR